MLPFLAVCWLVTVVSTALWGAPGWLAAATIAGLVPVASLHWGGRPAAFVASSPAFLDAVAPSVALISVGADNTYGHPNQEVQDALAGATILRTDLHGRVTVRSDVTHITAATERWAGS